MKTYRWNKILLQAGSIFIVSLVGCGKAKSEKGFFSDANICRPLALPDVDPTNFKTGNFAIPAPSNGAVRTAQLTAKETDTKSVWGAEIYMSALVSASAEITMKALVKRSSTQVELQTVGPDGSAAGQPLVPGTVTIYPTITPGWARMQFPGTLSLTAGDAVWLIAEPNFTGSQSVLWWYTTGDGAYVAPVGDPIYVNLPKIQAIHRLIYCE